MILTEPLKFAKDFIDRLNEGLAAASPEAKLSNNQKLFLSFCICAIMLSNSVCWAEFERMSLGRWTMGRLSWMFRSSEMAWHLVLRCSVKLIIKKYGITEGTLVIDDSDNKRSKNTTHISNVHIIKDKKTGGYIKGQNLVFLILVSNKITFPIDFGFYEPDPVLKEFRKKDKELRLKKIKKKDRPKEPKRNPAYPTKQELALKLLREFSENFPEIKVTCILADALYGNKNFMNGASALFKEVQVISQLKKTQVIKFRNKAYTLKEFFDKRPGDAFVLPIRGGTEKKVIMTGARLFVNAHGAKRFVIALRYEGEDENRYIIATNLCWAMTDIVKAYTMRWLVEVFFSDWKLYEGWCQLAKQPGVDGSCRGVILSLLTDHALLTHEDQFVLLDDKLPASTVGSLRAKIQSDALWQFVDQLLKAEDPKAKLAECVEKLKKLRPLAPSSKHLNNRDLGRLGPTDSLKRKYAA